MAAIDNLYMARLGPLAFLTITNDVTEALGDGFDTVGQQLLAAERSARAFSLTIPVRGSVREWDSRAKGLAMRRQVRQLIDNPDWASCLWFDFGPDPELNGWLAVGKADLKYSDGGVGFADFELSLSDCYLIGRPGTHAPARRISVSDRRTGLVPWDTKRTMFATSSAAPTDRLPLLPPSYDHLDRQDHPPLVGARGQLRNTGGVQAYGPTRSYAADVPYAVQLFGPQDGDLVSMDSWKETTLPWWELADHGTVRVFDRGDAQLPATNTDADNQPEDADSGYGWERLLGQPVRMPQRLAIDNGACRLIVGDGWAEQPNPGAVDGPSAATTVAVQVRATGWKRYETRGFLTVPDAATWREVVLIECTGERVVIALRGIGQELRLVLQRGWTGPLVEFYSWPGTQLHWVSVSRLANLTEAPDGSAAWQTGEDTTAVAVTATDAHGQLGASDGYGYQWTSNGAPLLAQIVNEAIPPAALTRARALLVTDHRATPTVVRRGGV